MKKARNVRWHTVLIDTLKTKTSNFVLNPSLHWKPVECSQQCCCTCMPGLKKDKSGCIILYALKLIQFVVLETSKERITVLCVRVCLSICLYVCVCVCVCVSASVSVCVVGWEAHNLGKVYAVSAITRLHETQQNSKATQNHSPTTPKTHTTSTRLFTSGEITSSGRCNHGLCPFNCVSLHAILLHVMNLLIFHLHSHLCRVRGSAITALCIAMPLMQTVCVPCYTS